MQSMNSTVYAKVGKVKNKIVHANYEQNCSYFALTLLTEEICNFASTNSVYMGIQYNMKKKPSILQSRMNFVYKQCC